MNGARKASNVYSVKLERHFVLYVRTYGSDSEAGQEAGLAAHPIRKGPDQGRRNGRSEESRHGQKVSGRRDAKRIGVFERVGMGSRQGHEGKIGIQDGGRDGVGKNLATTTEKSEKYGER